MPVSVPGGAYAPGARRAPTLRALHRQFMPEHVQVRQGKRGQDTSRVLRETAVPHLREAPQALHHMKHVLHATPRTRARLVDAIPVGGARAAPIHAIDAARRFPLHLVRLLPIRLVAEQRPFLAVQQVIELRDVGRRGVGRRHGMHDPTGVAADVHLHAEVPLLALARLLHRGITRFGRVLRRAGRRNDRRIDNRAGPEQPLVVLDQRAHRGIDVKVGLAK